MWPTVRNSAAFLVAGALAIAPAAARQQTNVFRGGTQTVPLYTTVLGPDGRLVTDLTKDDFEIYDDGRPQPIARVLVLVDRPDRGGHDLWMRTG